MGPVSSDQSELETAALLATHVYVVLPPQVSARVTFTCDDATLPTLTHRLKLYVAPASTTSLMSSAAGPVPIPVTNKLRLPLYALVEELDTVPTHENQPLASLSKSPLTIKF